MKSLFYLSILVLLSVATSCKTDCDDCDPRVGPMMSRIRGNLVWVKTQKASHTITPTLTGYNMSLLRLRQHVYEIKDDSIANVFRIKSEEDDWKNHRFYLQYENGYSQAYEFVYEGNDNRRAIIEVITTPLYKGSYSSSADTVSVHYKQSGSIDQKYWDDEEKRL